MYIKLRGFYLKEKQGKLWMLHPDKSQAKNFTEEEAIELINRLPQREFLELEV